jgi:integrase/recombinase XerD
MCRGLRVQSVVMPFGDPQSWTLVDRDSVVVEPVEGFLAHLHAVERSPNTVKAYAHDLRDWFEFLGQRGVVWSRVRLEDVGRFVAWLRLPASARVGNVAVLPTAESVCSEATVNRKLSAISVFYEFHQRHGVDLGDLLTTCQRRKAHGGSWRPLLALTVDDEAAAVVAIGGTAVRQFLSLAEPEPHRPQIVRSRPYA